MTLDIPGDNDYKITGDRLAWHFEITRTETGKKAGEVHKKYGIRDNYTVKVEDGESDLDILLLFGTASSLKILFQCLQAICSSFLFPASAQSAHHKV